MRIDCPKCRAVFAIDERKIPPKGVRAQCPKCSEQVVVRPPAPAAPPGPDPASDPFALARGAGAAPSRAAAPPPAPGGLDPFESLALDIAGPPRTGAPPPPKSGSLDEVFGAPPPRPASSAPVGSGDDLFEGAMTGSRPQVAEPPPPPPPPPRPATESLELATDSKPAPAARQAPPPAPNTSGAREDRSQWRVRKPDGVVIGPVPFSEMRDRAQKGEIIATDQFARGEDPFQATSAYPLLLALFSKAQQPQKAPPAAKRSIPVWGLAGVAVAVLGLVGGGIVFLRSSGDDEVALPTAKAFESRVTVWKLAQPDVAGTGEEHYQKGRQKLLADTPRSLREAAREFRSAVILSPKHYRAAAGYVEAFAILSADPTDVDAFQEAKDVIAHAAAAAPDDPAVLRAYAHLMLAAEGGGDLVDARQKAERAAELAPADAEVLLALARAQIPSDPDAAIATLDKALALNKTLKRAYLYRGVANERAGRYQTAVSDYERRLALAPDDREALHALAQVSVTVGTFERVRAIYQRILGSDPTAPEARLGMAVLAYQVENDLKRASELLGALVAESDVFEDDLRGRVLGHAAAVARELGDYGRAVEIASKADGLGAYAAPARYQAVLAQLRLSKVGDAQATLQKVGGRLGDESERALLEGRVHMAGLRHVEAAEAFKRAQQLAPRRLDPYFFLGAALVRTQRVQQAFGVMRSALEVDPGGVGRRTTYTDFFESRKQRLQGLDQAFLDVASEQIDVAPAYAFAGVIRYHLGETAGIEDMLKRTYGIDPQAFPPLVYMAQLALDKNDPKKALLWARQARQVEKLEPIGPYLEGRALELLHMSDEARAAYEAALSRNAKFYPASQRLGELLLAKGRRPDAEARFLEVFRGDPENADAKVALFRLGR